jgi:tetratricopeptide (TPR) repeat protein
VALDNDVIAVLPFRVTGADATYGEGMVDLLAAKLTGEGGPRATDPQSAVSAWHSAGGRNDLPREQALDVARKLGAGKLLTGSIVGTPAQLSLTASIVDVETGKEDSRGETSGSADSLVRLVDRLAAQLLAGSAGASGHILEKLTSTSLPALQSYLAGQALYRRGAYQEAMRQFQRAVERDSTFALAAIGLASSAHWLGKGDVRDGAFALADRLRDRLATRDAAFLDMKEAMAGYSEDGSYQRWTDAAQRLVTLAPESAEGWYDLGDSYFHAGGRLNLDRAEQESRAEAAFRRSTTLDSAFAAPLEHLIEMAAVRGDTAAVRSLARRYFQIDSTGDLADFMRWRVAAALRDSDGLAAVRARFVGMNDESLIRIAGTATLDGIELTDAESALAAVRQNVTSPEDQLDWVFRESDLLLNLGRPSAIVPFYAQLSQLLPVDGVLGPIFDATYGDGDTVTASARARAAAPIALGPINSDTTARFAQYNLMCAVSAWRMSRGDTAGVATLLGRLERPLLPTRATDLAERLAACADAIRGTLAIRQNNVTEARTRVERLETWLARRDYEPLMQLVIARIREHLGETALALRAIRHRPYHWNQTWLLSTLLREEGRLAAITGDRDGAIRAYQHYLRLREGAEPGLKPQVTQVRQELARLVGEVSS